MSLIHIRKDLKCISPNAAAIACRANHQSYIIEEPILIVLIKCNHITF